MLDLFSGLSCFFKIQESVCIDNNVFRLHYKGSVMILTMATLLVTARQYIGDPIDCMVEGIPANIMDTYCWIHSTFSIPERWVGEQGTDYAHPGLGPVGRHAKDIVHHKYYQWVVFVLALQAGLFYIPRYLWKDAEGGRLSILVSGMCGHKMSIGSEREERVSTIVKYFKEFRGSHFSYLMKFTVCEWLNMINVVGQMYLMDRFLGGEFSTYGLRVLAFSELDSSQREDPMAVVFPKVSKCTFSKYGVSGTLERHDALCVLPLNIINEKIYIFLWFWFIVLASTTGIVLVYRMAILFGPGIRVGLIQARCGRLGREKIEDILTASNLSYREQVGDFFLLYLIAKNVDELTMKELIIRLHSNLRPFYPKVPSYSETATLKCDNKFANTSV